MSREIEKFLAKAHQSGKPDVPKFRQAKAFNNKDDPIKLMTMYSVLDGRILQTRYGTRCILTLQELDSDTGKKVGEIQERFCFGELAGLYWYEDPDTKRMTLKDPDDWFRTILFLNIEPTYKFKYF
jgi:hypothetical protein